jgi:NAD(P)-dependent dehydrogenase (short-subunit alcohol dehydrogenase family)
VELRDKVVVVTGGANGIGEALVRRFAQESPRGIVVADIDAAGTERVAGDLGDVAIAASCDVSVEADVHHLVEVAEKHWGPVDLFCSNAGIGTTGGVDVSDEAWDRIWRINVLAHVFAARAVLPSMLARGEGYLLQTASAAGLLSQIGSAPYSVTKHAAVGFAEYLAIAHGDQGIKVSCLCPQGVKTNMLLGGRDIGDAGASAVLAAAEALEPSAVADVVVEGLRAETFLILPHPEVLTYLQRKASDYDRWLAGMRRFQARVRGVAPDR